MNDEILARVDLQQAGLLLHIVEKCAGHSGKLGALSNAAMTGLMNINEGIKKAAEEAKSQLVEIPDPPSSADLLPPNELNPAKETHDE